MNSTLNKSLISTEFKIKDLVFAKVRGHKHWPAQIVNIDSVTCKNIIKYTVSFFATNEKAIVKKNEMCHYIENKAKYLPQYISLRYRDSYKMALTEIEKVLEADSLLDQVGSPVATKHSIKTPSSKKKKINSLKCSTPCVVVNDKSHESCDDSKQNRSTRDASINTTIDLDLNFQLHAVTDKCIELEKNLIDIKNLSQSNNNIKTKHTLNTIGKENQYRDFHTEILKQQLDQIKLENKNLQTAIEILQADYKRLEQEYKQLQNNGQGCPRCFPPLHPGSSNPWQTVRNCCNASMDKAKNTFQDKNPYAVLEQVSEADSMTTHLGSLHKPKEREYLLRNNCGKLNKTEVKKSKIFILADSHGRYIRQLIEQKTSFKVSSVIKPNAKLCNVIKGVKELCGGLGKEDYLLVIGGTNNIECHGSGNFLNEIRSLISIASHTNLVIATVPWRYDDPRLDANIAKVNGDLENVVTEYPNVSLLPLHLLPRHLFTSHGLHFNKRGKVKIVEMFIKQFKARMTNASKKNITAKCDKREINVLETNMKTVIDDMRKDPSVAFAHTISADFTDPKHMSSSLAYLPCSERMSPNMSSSQHRQSLVSHSHLQHTSPIASPLHFQWQSTSPSSASLIHPQQLPAAFPQCGSKSCESVTNSCKEKPNVFLD